MRARLTEQFFTQVLDYYHAPRAHPAAVDAATLIPGEFSAFLECLARPEERLAPVARSLGCDTDELLAASCFYIRQLLFLDDRDHYRILGLSANAGNNEIRRRYRLLISLFHPDRIQAKGHGEEQFVRRLNRAYGVLKSPEKRRAYDRERKRNTRVGGAAPKKHRHARRTGGKMPPRAGGPQELLYRSRFLQRHPKVVIWLVILLLLGAVLLAFLYGSKHTTLTQAKPEPASANMADRVPASLFSSADANDEQKE